MFDLTGRVAIITGASQGIGQEISRLLASYGASVALIARNEEKLESFANELNNSGFKALAVPCDMTKVDQLPSIVEGIYNHFGRIDILVNNAGVNIAKPAEEVTEEDWDQVLDLNLKSVFFCNKAVSKYMKENNYGKIINMSSQMAIVGYFNRSAYCSSKGGLMQQTRALAIEWAKFGINVNSIAPTFIETPMTKEMFKDTDFKMDVLNRIPIGRLAKPEDLFGALVFLSSSSSNMVTGQTLFVDGGWTVW
ncbi:glucose 1-dehydrogenase [Metabacillus sp. BG109]|uniref:Glucose 1-dehydrogenase n=2 Tax=Metabacillus bambusae TaxID=2795218 RepID=A0ABS3MZS9_9BACI|nr:glucose 1-dehydrogenase [Metabacillus bambusae]